MKKILLITIFSFSFLLSFTQNISEQRAKELFGYRFISYQEAGFSNKIEIPFAEEEIKYDFRSWLIPLNIDGKPTYKLIQARYSLGPKEIGDTLSLTKAQEIIELLSRIRPSFPNEEGTNQPFEYFFLTKDKAPIKSGMEMSKAISYNNKQMLIIDLPINAKAGIMEANYISYLVDNRHGEGVLGLTTLPNNFKTTKEQYVHILALVYLTP
ncbi:MAG: hypothetical protein WAW11_02490 [Patescibacteria group bacterium]